MKRTLRNFLIIAVLLTGTFSGTALAQTYHSLSSGSFLQNWSNTGLITTNDSWSGVASIIGFLGDDGSTTAAGADPQLIIVPFTTIDVIANQTNPSTNSSGGVGEFEITDPTIALQGSGTADYPYIAIYLNTTGCSNIQVKYDLRDIDGATDNAIQPVALQYRIGNSGNFTNVPSAFVADATSGPSLATMVTNVNVTLPSACDNQAILELRIITANASGSDEWVGIDNIDISQATDSQAPVATFNPANSVTNVNVWSNLTISFNEAIRKIDGSVITDGELSSLLVLKKTDALGVNVPYTATIDASKKVITVTPSSNLDNLQAYYLAINPVEDASGNESLLQSATFTTMSATTPALTLTYPVGNEKFYAGQAATLTWNSANVTNVKVEVWAPDGVTRVWSWQPFVPSTPAAAGKVDITVPSNAPYGTEYKIRVSDVDNATLNSTSGNFTVICVATSITDLRQRCIANDIVKLSSEATVTFLRTLNRNQKYIQDAAAGLLIDDASAVLTTTIAQGDNIKNLEGKLGLYGGALQIVPTMPTVTIASSGNTVSIPEMTLADYMTNYLQYESELIKISSLRFTDGNGTATFAASTNYNITDGTNTIVFRTFLAGEGNIVGSIIPQNNISAVLIGGFFNTTVQVYGRNTSDFAVITGVEKDNERSLMIYPVPATSVLNVKNISSVNSIEILDVTGKVVYRLDNIDQNELRIPVENLRKGMYFLKMTTPEGKTIKRFIKQ